MNTAVTNKQIYFNTSSCGLIDPADLQHTNELYARMQEAASLAIEDLRDNGLQRIRATIASFINAPASNIALVPNFSYGFNALVQSLKGTEKVMLYKQDYPSVYEPFRINNFDISWIDAAEGFTIDTDELKKALLNNKIDILAISHVQWLSGFKLDIKAIGEFCSVHNIIFIVDTTQSTGAVQIDMNELKADAVIWSNYKWMNAGFGHGAMYVSDKFLERYKPVIGGHGSYAMIGGEWKYEPGIKSYEPGHLNFHGLLLLEAAIKQKQAQGMKAIEDHNMALTQQLLDGIRKAGHQVLGPWTLEHRCSIILLKAVAGLHKHLWEHNIITIQRGDYIRIGLHYYNTMAETEQFVACLQAFGATSPN